MNLFIILAFTLTGPVQLLCLTEEPHREGRIYNGQKAHPNQFPYMVFIEIANSLTETTCGGFLIEPNWVLTAAHCFEKFKYAIVYLGTTDVEYADIAYLIKPYQIFIHPNYESFSHDIALVKIPHTTVCDKVSAIKLPQTSSRYSMYTGSYAVVSGWGKTSDRDPASPFLKWTRLPIMANNVCGGITPGITVYHLCADTSNGTSTAYGDSGGPLVLEATGEAVGIASGVCKISCELGMPALFTRVTYYLDWIRSVIEISQRT